MGQTASRSKSRKNIRWAAWCVVFGLTALAWAQDITFSAKVDKTTIELGDPVSLTLTLNGDISGIQLPSLQLPEGFSIIGRSQSTNFSLRAGTMERSVSLVYILLPQRAGTFKLGPFTLQHHHRELKTEPIEMTVKKPALPPHLQPQGERFTL